MSEKSSSDAELLRQYVTAADRGALGALVRRHVDFVYGVARRQMRGDAHAADDVTQAVFLVLAGKAASVPPARLGGWLFRTTCYAAANARKRARRRAYHERRVPLPEPVMPAEPIEPNPLLPLLDDALASLRAVDREAVILRYLQGRDVAAVGAALGTSEVAARRRIGRAVEKLRGIFTARGALAADAAAVVTVVTLAAASPAPAAVVSSAAGAALGTAAASAGAVSITKGVAAMLIYAKVKAVAVVVLSAALLTGAGFEVVRRAVAAPPTKAVAADDEPPVTRSSTFTATLANGVGVELIGVGENPSLERPWWKPDGAPLATAPYATMSGSTATQPGWVSHELAFRLRTAVAGRADAAAIRWTVPDSGGWAGGGPMSADGRGVEDVTAFAFRHPQGRPASVRFDVAAGAWEVDTTSAANGSSSGSLQNRSYILGHAINTGKDVLLVASLGGEYLKRDVRLVGLGHDGKEHVARSNGGSSNGDMQQITWLFPSIRVADLNQVRLESRPFDQWIEFRDVSLEPGKATVTTAITSDAGAALRGAWRLTRAEENGRPRLAEQVAGMRVYIDGGEMRVVSPGGKTERAGLTLDHSKSPNWIDLSLADSARGGRLILQPGLFERRGDEVWMVFNKQDTGRPTGFVSEPAPSPNASLWVLRREVVFAP